MADDRHVFPEDAQEAESPAGPARGRSTGRWLNRETAERLLAGEAADNAVAPAHRDEADRLARTLGALAAMSAPPVREDEELPGEAAALAAFRKARADRAPDAGPAFLPGPAFSSGRAATREPASGDEPVFPHRPAPAEDAVLVRIGGSVRSSGRRLRRSRPARLGLAAALTVGMVGGVAVAAGGGFLPTPFDDAGPGPAASVSAAATPGPDRPLGSPTPGASPGGTGPAAPGGGAQDTPAPGPDGSGGGAHADDLAASCREKGAGRALAAERRRALEHAAGGPARVPAYCAELLGGREDRGSGEPSGGKARDDGGVGGSDEQGDTGEQGGNENGNQNGGQSGKENGGQSGGQSGSQNGGRSAGQSGGTTGKGSESRGGRKSAQADPSVRADPSAQTDGYGNADGNENGNAGGADDAQEQQPFNPL
ncbi:hypothetical protein L1856_29175 [Streptomyces sp. Tue 6430]|nr:hypothetical protein [Streptomyces sp. Tue 6430]